MKADLKMRWAGLLLALCAALQALPLPAHAQAAMAADAASRALPTIDGRQRLALVIGNAAYEVSPLRNPVNDARAMMAALREAGFTVIYRENVDQRGMLLALREFGDRLRGGGTGLFYFSGHGMQIKGRNYLIPIGGATFEREDEAAYKTVDAQAVLDKMEVAGNMSNIMILDACRSNPFARNSRAPQQGLAQMDAPVGTMIAYATAPGSVASDGTVSTGNGLYTHHLLAAMRQPGSKLEDVFKQVRGAVRRDSNGAQIPWESTSLEGDFYFRMPEGSGPAAPQPQALAAAADQVEIGLWDAVKDSTVPAEIALYLKRYPTGRFAAAARQRLTDAGGAPASQALPAAGPVAASTQLPSSKPNAAGISKGDRWRYQVVDKYKGEVVRNYANVVDGVDADGSLVLNGGRMLWDARGNLRALSNPEGDLNFPSYIFVPENLQAGARSALNFKVTRTQGGKVAGTDTGRGSMTVKSQERIVTPAGEFTAWRVDIEVYGSTVGQGREDQRLANGGSNVWRWTVKGWYSPELHGYVAYDDEIRMATGYQNSSTNSYSVRERHELTSFSVSGVDNLASR